MIVGIGSIILGVKDTSGFGIYHSNVVPHYANYDCDFLEIDYLQKYLTMAHGYGLRMYAGIDVFSEGRTQNPHALSPGFAHPNWQTNLYGLDEEENIIIQPVSNPNFIQTADAIDDFQEVFVNPVSEEVQNYELQIIEELINQYNLDGIVLDRVRFVGLSSDFSYVTRKKFEAYKGSECKEWPSSIFTMHSENKELKINYGTDFGLWLTFRASVIKEFIQKVRTSINKCDRKIEFLDYTGSWYPLYYQVGANWASEDYKTEEYQWVDPQEYQKTGYAKEIDKLLSGFYCLYNGVKTLAFRRNL